MVEIKKEKESPTETKSAFSGGPKKVTAEVVKPERSHNKKREQSDNSESSESSDSDEDERRKKKHKHESKKIKSKK